MIFVLLSFSKGHSWSGEVSLCNIILLQGITGTAVTFTMIAVIIFLKGCLLVFNASKSASFSGVSYWLDEIKSVSDDLNSLLVFFLSLH